MTKVHGLALLVPLTLAACDGTPPHPAAQELRSDKVRVAAPVVSTDDAAALAAGNAAFAVDMHAKLRALNPSNFIFSQTSISLALAMLYGGAVNATAAQMATTLHFTLPAERLHPAFNALDLALITPPAGSDPAAFRLAIANSIWGQEGFGFLPSYLDLLAENYGAGLFAEDFAGAPETARAAINGWVSDETEHMIPELFPKGMITPDTMLVLANAVFFHGDWNAPFKAPSADGTFHAPTGDVTVKMMIPSAEINGAGWSGAGWSAAALRYKGDTTSMVVVVPDAGTFDAFEQGLTADGLAAILAPAQTGSAAVTLPKFKISTGTSLAGTLIELGMVDAFGPGADLSGIDGALDLSVQAVIHKAVIEVDEKGTTAAAATGVVVGTTGVVVIDKVLVVDRPFLFFIRHDPTGAILFQGRVVDPSK